MISALHLPSKCSFTTSKLRFFGLASLEIPLVIQHLKEEAVATKLLDSLFLFNLCIEKKDYRYEVAQDRYIYHKVPDEVVVLKSLFGIEPRTDSVEDSAGGNQHK